MPSSDSKSSDTSLLEFFSLIHIPLFLSKYALGWGAVTRSRRAEWSIFTSEENS